MINNGLKRYYYLVYNEDTINLNKEVGHFNLVLFVK